MRRGRSGRRLLAVRTNERAAAALGISVPGAKIYAFALSAGIAAVGGTLLAFRKDTIVYGSEFTNFTSITAVGWAFVGGIGYLVGPALGATLAPGSLGARLSDAIFSGLDRYLQVIGGAIVILLVLQNQDGMAKESAAQLKWIGRKIWGLIPNRKPLAPEAVTLPPERRERVAPKVLEVRELTVRYGGVTAVDSLSLTVQPGRITGLIGPNGAGKTSAIDAITGFTAARSGVVFFDGNELNALSPAKRVRAGLSRLVPVARAVRGLDGARQPARRVRPARPAGRTCATSCIPSTRHCPVRSWRRSTSSSRRTTCCAPSRTCSYGQRRLLAIARAVATQPSVLLLDEPAAGLGDAETAELAPPGAPARRRLGHGHPARRARHELRDERVRRHRRARLRPAASPRDRPTRSGATRRSIAAYLGQSEEAPTEVPLEVAAGRRGRVGGDVSDRRQPERRIADGSAATIVGPAIEARGLSAGYGPQPVVHELRPRGPAGRGRRPARPERRRQDDDAAGPVRRAAAAGRARWRSTAT